MRTVFIALFACLALPGIAFSQKKIIVAIGSSTTFGYGASTFDSSWVGRAITYYVDGGLGPVSTVYDLGQPGAASAAGMPTGTRGTPGQYDPNFTITAAMSLNPDVVIINYPSNDIIYDTPVAAYLFNLRTMYQVVTDAGKICYVTTTQPRTTFGDQQTMNLKIAHDSILQEFGPFALEFYEPLIIPGTTHFDPALMHVDNPGDTIHPNDAGHALLFQTVKNNVVLSSIPLALTLTGFSARIDNGAATIQWTSVNEQGPTLFEVQKSADGRSFATVHQESGRGGSKTNTYSWTDNDLLSGASFYRLQITETGKESLSQIASLDNRSAISLISRLYIQRGNMLFVELDPRQVGPVDLGVYTATGSLIARQKINGGSTAAPVALPLMDLSTGIYFLRVSTASGQKETRAFSKF